MDGYGYYQGGVLFSNRGDGDKVDNISASNITLILHHAGSLFIQVHAGHALPVVLQGQGVGGIAGVHGVRDQLVGGQVVTKEYEYYDGGPLFSNSGDGNDTTGITAANKPIFDSLLI